MLALLVFLLQLGKLFAPLLLLSILVVAVYFYIYGAFRLGRPVGSIAVLLLFGAVGWIGIVQFRAHTSHTEFVQSLSRFDTVTVQTHSMLPSAPIEQISLKNNVSDADLQALVSMPQLQHVTHVYLDDCDITDSGLSLVDRWPHLEYVYIESRLITDSAIVDFIKQHPQCSVIPPGRKLW
ncbi:hypothetical protein A6X21_02040 [Planctopirus hydrillae]|uniref:Uncharacterized protein n=1 Tax=Planctopirus hydrillae TaxID=1841610 RepID=A0A1C3ETC6_9PLAN|nr:hypothetical protein A6X21_02040 [Planctopirus hydrillae]